MMNRSSVQGGIWLIGIGVLAFTGYWWPGVMFVLAVSALAGGSFQSATWAAGIGLLAWTGFWWPGILFVVGASMIVQTLLPDKEHRADEDEDVFFAAPPQESRTPEGGAPERALAADHPGTGPAAKPLPHDPIPDDSGWLPGRCPSCGGPLAPETVTWHAHTGGSATCPWCDTVLEKPA